MVSTYGAIVRTRKWYNFWSGCPYNASVRYRGRHLAFSMVIRFCIASNRVALRRFATSQLYCRLSHRAVASRKMKYKSALTRFLCKFLLFICIVDIFYWAERYWNWMKEEEECLVVVLLRNELYYVVIFTTISDTNFGAQFPFEEILKTELNIP